MASWFRSETMTYVSLVVNEDAAHGCIGDLGKLGVIQFTDLNPELTPFQRRYVAYIKRVDELERKIAYFYEEVKKFELKVQPVGSIESFVQGPSRVGSREGGVRSGLHLLETLEVELEGLESQLLDLNRYSERLTSEYNEKVEFQEVLLKARGFFTTEAPKLRMEAAAGGRPYQVNDFEAGSVQGPGGPQPLLARDGDMRFSYVAGVVRAEDRGRFERQLFRTTRGNCYVRFAEIDQPIADPGTGEMVSKLVFLVFYKSAAIEAKIKKIADAFGARRYPVPDMDNGELVTRMMNDNYADLHDGRVVLLKNRDARLEVCHRLATRLEDWSWTVLREKSVYHTLNMFRPDVRGILRGEGWVVSDSLAAAQAAVNKAHASMDMGMPSMVQVLPKPWPTPPTYFRINAFTYAFQELVNTYGTPRYKEANPALFAAGTFPFLYGVMYGDVGHGSILFMAGLYLLYTHKNVAGRRDLGEMVGAMYSARYMLAMMGFFSVYCGFIYNDFFSIGLDIFGSSYSWGDDPQPGDKATFKSDYGDANAVYPFGSDPSWHIAGNELLFFNSMKMKMSVILGICQMTVAICFKASNAIYFNEPLDFFFEWIPMILFDGALFCYMVILIFVKWSIDWDARMYSATCFADLATSTHCSSANSTSSCATPAGLTCTPSSTTAEMCPLNYGGTGDGCQPPNLITQLINIALQPGAVAEPMYKGQAGLQTFLLLVAFLSVPVLLLAKPLILRSRMQEEERAEAAGLIPDARSNLMDHDEHAEDGNGDVGGGHHAKKQHHGHGEAAGGGHHDFGEVVIHQAIETIEFVLGMVSNTASYLRLWALSLAHTELASVFWEKAMLATIQMGNPFAVVVGYAMFAGTTFGVLLCMDVLECFLHALRLTWVESMNKHYKGDGLAFTPLSFTVILENSKQM